METVTKHYENRQDDYTHSYTFQFRWTGTHYDIFALRHPPDRHGKGGEHHHLMPNDKLCVRPGCEHRDLEHAEAFAYWWMMNWSEYVTTGTFRGRRMSFNMPG